MARQSQKSDFDPDELTKITDKHEGYIIELHNRLQALENKFSTNEILADTLQECSRNAVKFREMFSDVLVAQLKTDAGLRDTLREFIDHSDRNSVRKMVKQVGIAIWSIFLIILGVALGYYFN